MPAKMWPAWFKLWKLNLKYSMSGSKRTLEQFLDGAAAAIGQVARTGADKS